MIYERDTKRKKRDRYFSLIYCGLLMSLSHIEGILSAKKLKTAVFKRDANSEFAILKGLREELRVAATL